MSIVPVVGTRLRCMSTSMLNSGSDVWSLPLVKMGPLCKHAMHSCITFVILSSMVFFWHPNLLNSAVICSWLLRGGGVELPSFEEQTLFKWQYIDLIYWKHQKKNSGRLLHRSFEDFKIKLDPPLIYKNDFLNFVIKKTSYTLKEAHLNTDWGTVGYTKNKWKRNDTLVPGGGERRH